MQCWRFLQSIDDNFLMQVVEEPIRRGALLDLVLTNKERLFEDVEARGRLISVLLLIFIYTLQLPV